MMIEVFPPALALIIGGFLLPFFNGRLRDVAVLLFPVISLWLVWEVPDGSAFLIPFLEYQLEPVKGDALSRVFGTIFSIMAFAGGLFALRQATSSVRSAST